MKLLKGLKAIVFGIGCFAILYGSWITIEPIIDKAGVIEIGAYRGINIGDTKRTVVLKTTVRHAEQSSLRISAYTGPDQKLYFLYNNESPYHLMDSDRWILMYPSIHNENVIITFKNSMVIRIEYKRNILVI